VFLTPQTRDYLKRRLNIKQTCYNEKEKVNPNILFTHSISFYEVAAAFIITHERCGYVKDEDASNINYDDLLKEMQHATEEENNKLPARHQFKLVPRYKGFGRRLPRHLRLLEGEGTRKDSQLALAGA